MADHRRDRAAPDGSGGLTPSRVGVLREGAVAHDFNSRWATSPVARAAALSGEELPTTSTVPGGRVKYDLRHPRECFQDDNAVVLDALEAIAKVLGNVLRIRWEE